MSLLATLIITNLLKVFCNMHPGILSLCSIAKLNQPAQDKFIELKLIKVALHTDKVLQLLQKPAPRGSVVGAEQLHDARHNLALVLRFTQQSA